MAKISFFKSFGFGVGSALVAMAVYPLIASSAKPLMKSVIKGGLGLKDQMKLAYAESKEQFEDMVAEVKEEIKEEKE